MKINPPTTMGRIGTGVFRPPVIVVLVVFLMAGAGFVFKLGPDWRYLTDGVTAFAVILVLWEAQRQRQHAAARMAEQIEEVLKLLRSAKADLSSAELKNIEAELQRLQLEVLSRATLKR
jgi:hypothetical protein